MGLISRVSSRTYRCKKKKLKMSWQDQSSTGLWPNLIKTVHPDTYKISIISTSNNETSGTLYIGASYLLFKNNSKQLSFGLENSQKIITNEYKTKTGMFSSKHVYQLILVEKGSGQELTKIHSDKSSVLEQARKVI